MDSSFEMYLINVGMRSEEFTHEASVLYSNIEYFRGCYESNLSAYKALLFLGDYLLGGLLDEKV
jgi:hypothetical protein